MWLKNAISDDRDDNNHNPKKGGRGYHIKRPEQHLVIHGMTTVHEEVDYGVGHKSEIVKS